MSMIGITPNALGMEQQRPNFHGSADIVFDGKYLWVSNRDFFGEPPTTTITAGSNGQTLPQSIINVVSSSGFTTGGSIYVRTSDGIQTVNYTGTNFPTNTQFTGCTGGSGTMSTGGLIDTDRGRNKLIWVIDPNPGIPRVIATINLSAYTFSVVRGLSKSNNGLYIYACLAGTPGGAAGRCLVINKTTFAIVGNAQIKTTSVGSPGAVGGRAVFAGDDGADHLWVVNSNQSSGNAIERFSLTTVLANGTSPTTSVQTINLTNPNHAEELAFGGGWMWACSSDYGSTITRIDPATGSFSTQTVVITSSVFWGPKYLHNALWGGSFGNKIARLEPSAFGTGGFLTDSIVVGAGSNSGQTTLGAFASDGTFIWTGGAYETVNTSVTSASNGQVLPQSVINVGSTNGWPTSGVFYLRISSTNFQVISYTGTTPGSFTGCTGGVGTLATSQNIRLRTITLSKITTGAGSVSVVKDVNVIIPPNSLGGFSSFGFYNLTFDGTYIWGVERVTDGIASMIKIDPTPGSEKAVMVWPTGGVFSQQT